MVLMWSTCITKELGFVKPNKDICKSWTKCRSHCHFIHLFIHNFIKAKLNFKNSDFHEFEKDFFGSESVGKMPLKRTLAQSCKKAGYIERTQKDGVSLESRVAKCIDKNERVTNTVRRIEKTGSRTEVSYLPNYVEMNQSWIRYNVMAHPS